MNKQEFLYASKSRLSALPLEDVQKSLDYYSELIDDYIEDGKSEEEAISSLGDINDIVSQIYQDTPLPKLMKAKVKPSRALRVWEIILLILGSPIWFSLLISVFAVILSVYVVLWSVVVALYSVVLSIALVTLVTLLGVFVSAVKGLFLNAIIFFGLTLLLAGITILLCIGTNYFTKAMVFVSKWIVKSIKNKFVRRSV